VNQDQATAQLRRATELIDLNRPEQALEVLGALLTTAPPLAARIYALMTSAHLQLGHVAEAVRTAQEAVRADPSLPVAQLMLANAFQYSSRSRQAVAAARNAIALDPTLVDAYHTGAQALSDLRKHAEAERWAQTAVELDPSNPDGHFAMGYVLHERRPAVAIAAYRAALERNPAHMMALQNLATLTVKSGDRDAGAKMMADVLAGTRGAKFTVGVLDVMITQITLRLHRVSLLLFFVINMLLAAAWGATAPNPWPATVAAGCCLGLAVLLLWWLSARGLRGLRDALPRQGAGFLRGYPRRNPVATAWLGLVAAGWLLVTVGFLAAIVGAAAGIPEAPTFVLVGGSVAIGLQLIGAVLSWVHAFLVRRRLRSTRHM
jgi:Tfp pilus assembly protein PilF